MIAMRHELDQRRRVELLQSLMNPHPETVELADEGLKEWAGGWPAEDTEGLVDNSVATTVRWVMGEGWIEDPA